MKLLGLTIDEILTLNNHISKMLKDSRMIKLQKFCASFVKGKFCSTKDVVSLKWLMVSERTDFTVLKMTCNGFLNEGMPSKFHISIMESRKN